MTLEEHYAKMSDITLDELKNSLESLVDKGIFEKVIMDNGEIHYNPTDFGRTVGRHLCSELKFRN